MNNKDTDRPTSETPGSVWPPAPQGRPPKPSTPPRRRILTSNVWLDAALGMLIGVVATVLLDAAVESVYWTLDGSSHMVALGITTLVNMAACLAVGRRFPVLAVATAMVSATVVVLLWHIMLPMSGMQFGSEGKASE